MSRKKKANNSRRVLITGASGFIGSQVCRELPKDKKIAVSSPFSEKRRLDGVGKNVFVVKTDLTDIYKVKRLFSEHKPDVVIHLATHGVYGYQQADEERIVVGNYQMAFNLLKLSVETGVKKFVNAGSVFEYGSQEGKMKEDQVDIADILNKYSAVKMATTALATSFSSEVSVVTVRPFTAYGPRGDKARFVMATILRALKNEDIRIVEDVVRDFVYIEDLAKGIIQAAKKNVNSGEVINLGSGKKHSLEEASKLIKRLCSSKSKIIVDKKYKRPKESKCWADITKAREVLGWEPEHTFKEGLQKTVDWVKKNF